MVRLGVPRGDRRYRCAEHSGGHRPDKRTLKPGESDRVAVQFGTLRELEPGEYEAWLEHHPSKLRSQRVRFRVVP